MIGPGLPFGVPRRRDNPYARFAAREMTLNDFLAIDRTVLANERTLLAYARTALAMLAIGGSAIRFFDADWVVLVGVPFIVGGAAVMILGVARYRRTCQTLPHPQQATDPSEPSPTQGPH